ncbi:DUF6361 family protein [Paracoccus marcusii]|uniref:DUF6361 family protein n=1 Tax=Paracoccus marcusii TaxID=59779 RepID=UPI0039C8B0FF
MHGAALLYNLALSELRQRDDWIDTYRERLEAWSDELDLGAVRTWSLDDFWNVVEHPTHAIRPAAKRFVTEWRELVLAGPEQVFSAPAGRQLVEERSAGSRPASHATPIMPCATAGPVHRCRTPQLPLGAGQIPSPGSRAC